MKIEKEKEQVEKETQETAPFDLNMHVARLLMNEPFFAALSRRIDKSENRGIPTAAVFVDPKSAQFHMWYNPEFFARLTDIERAGVLKHEFYHLIFEHVTGRRPDGENMMMWNYATDLAINSHLQGQLPEGCLMPGKDMFAEYEAYLSAEQYLKKLKKDENFDKEKGKGKGEPGDCKGDGGEPGEGEGEPGKGGGMPDNGQFDSHDQWEEVDQTTKEIAKERLKDALKKASEEASKSNSWGTVPSAVRKEILDRLSGTIDWRKVLRYFVKTSQRANKTSTVKRINKRYPYIHPGKKVRRQASIAISIDQSGSVSDAMLACFFAELNSLSSLANFTVIPFDTEVAEDKVYVWKKGEKRKWERVRCGGTCFNAPTEYVNARSFDGHIVLTDLEAPKPKASKCQRMWMTTKDNAARPYFKTNERIVAIEPKVA
jgi:predicted metal-dependent peptidase